MKYLALTLALLCGCATFKSAEQTVVADADKAADKLAQAVAAIRKNVQPYAILSEQLCLDLKASAETCAKVDVVADKLVTALDDAQSAVDAYRAGKLEVEKAVDALKAAEKIAQDYLDLVFRMGDKAAAGALDADAGIVEA